MRSSRLVVLAVLSVAVGCVALIHSLASGQASATLPATTTSAGKPSSADLAVALKVAAMLNKCGSCHNLNTKVIIHGWVVAGKEVLWGQDLTKLVAEGFAVPGNPEGSKIYQHFAKGGHPQVPTTPEQTKLLEQWIARGCIDPKIKPARPALSEAANNRKAAAVLDRCSQCHSHGWQEEGKPKVTWGKNIPRLVAEGKYVVPGKPDESVLLGFVHDEKHPKYDTPEKMADDARALEQWISQGCADPAAKPATSKAATQRG